MTAMTTFALASALALSLVACSSDGSDLDSSLVISNESSSPCGGSTTPSSQVAS